MTNIRNTIACVRSFNKRISNLGQYDPGSTTTRNAYNRLGVTGTGCVNRNTGDRTCAGHYGVSRSSGAIGAGKANTWQLV